MSDAEPRKRRLVSFADIAAKQQEQAGPSPASPRVDGTRRPERVTYADLAALSRRPEDFEARLEPHCLVLGVPGTSAPDGLPDATGSAQISHKSGNNIKGVPGSGTPNRDANTSDPESGIPATGEVPIPSIAAVQSIRQRHQIRLALTARDGHSLGEQAVYDALWENAAPHTPEARIISAGYRPLSALCRLTVNNCKANLQSLIRKLAIEEVTTHSYTKAKTYIVYGEAAILARRRAAGLTHYVRSRGIAFVDPESGMEQV